MLFRSWQSLLEVRELVLPAGLKNEHAERLAPSEGRSLQVAGPFREIGDQLFRSLKSTAM